jgi:chromate transporter
MAHDTHSVPSRNVAKAAGVREKIMSNGTSLPRPESLGELFITFTLLALQGFGGVLAVSQRVLCEQKQWLSSEQFVEVLAMSHVLPGPNVCNLAMIVGDRFFGWRGAFTALAGMMVIPLVIVLALTATYARLEFDPAIAGALRGMGAVTAGLVIGTGLSLAHTLAGNAMRIPACIVVGLATFVAVALLHWPVWSTLGIGLLACGYAWHCVGDAGAVDGTERA